MSPTRATLALALLVGCASHAPPPAGETGGTAATTGAAGAPFDGCTGTYTTVIGWSFECGATTVLTREGDDADMLLRGARTSMRGTFSGSVEERFEPVAVAGATR
ncbi:MAG TPA: hypothetical protein VE987_02105, partial [Polyangiaceae bacterium]|nr:hypothetical protein [Polyangiaceae bacterium]